MRRSFDTRVSISIENGLLIGLVQPLATLVLVSTYIYLEKAAEPRAIHRNLQQRPEGGCVACASQYVSDDPCMPLRDDRYLASTTPQLCRVGC